MFVTQHLRAENDVNGNPRRVFVLYRVSSADHYAEMVGVEDEGYAGKPKAWAAYPELPPVNVAPKVYRAFLKAL